MHMHCHQASCASSWLAEQQGPCAGLLSLQHGRQQLIFFTASADFWWLVPCRIVKNGENNYTVTYRAGSDGPEQTMEVGLVMMATGRHPRVGGLNLQVRKGSNM